MRKAMGRSVEFVEGLERLGIDWAIEHPGCLDTIVTKRADEGHGRRFVDEDKAARVDPVAIMDPSPAPSCDVRADLFGGQNGFF